MLITHATVVGLDCLLPDYAVRFQDGLVVEVAPTGELAAAPGEEVFDAEGRYLAPGYVDLHIHGTGHYLIDNGPDDLAALCRLLPRYGVTSFMPTVCPLRPARTRPWWRAWPACARKGRRYWACTWRGLF